MNIPVQAEILEIHCPEVSVSRPEYIYLKENRKTVKILLNDILFIESMNDYLKVVTNQKTFVSKFTISNIAEQLENKGFLRIHRSFIVALNKVESFTNETIQIGKHELPISLSYKHEVEKTLMK
jgi:DNA-binding LytR/AlgR family response regulator